jgi:hypothetical protein
MVIGDGIKPVLTGLALGILGVLGLREALASLVYAVLPGSACNEDRSLVILRTY